VADALIDGNQSFGIKFAERDLQCPLVLSQRSQTVEGEMDTFADADSRGTSEQQGIGEQVIGTAKFLLKQSILFGGERSGKVARLRREVLGEDQGGLQEMARGG